VAGPRVGGPAVPAPSVSAVATDGDGRGRGAVPAEVVSVLGRCEQALEGDAIGLAATYCFDSATSIRGRTRWRCDSSGAGVGRLGVRRIPVQLFEAALALGLSATTLVLGGRLPLPGAVFVGALYTAGRQLLFPLRGEPRRTRAGRPLTLPCRYCSR